MLAALMLAGLAAVAMVPFAFDHLAEDDADDPGDDGPAPVGDGSSGDGALIDMSGDDGGAAPAGVRHDIPAASGDAVVTGFDPACDHCTLTIDTWDSDVVLDEDAEGVSVSFTNAADGIVTVRFPGLSDVPVDAITICVDAAGEGAAVTFPLAAIFPEADGAGSGIEDVEDPDPAPQPVLTPFDPDAPDDLPDPLDGALPLEPVDPDTPDLPPADPSDGDALPPVVEDDAPQDRSLIRGDPVTGAPLPAVIEGFDSGDLLAITLSPAAFPGPLDVTVMPAATGGATTVLVDGQPVALVTGPAAPESAQIRVSLAERISR